MIQIELQDEISLHMIRASMKAKYGLVNVAEAHGITLMQAMMLCLLEEGKPVPTSSFANFLVCDPSNVTGMVDRLAAGNFVERREHPQDRRVKCISITKKGMDLRSELVRIAAETRLPNIQDLTTDEAKQLIQLLDKATGSTTITSVTK